MDYPNLNTNHEKGKHLSYADYVIIELRLKDGWTPNAIARKELHCAPNTVRNIIKKGMTPLYNGKVLRFKAKTAWKSYQENRSHSCRTYKALEKLPSPLLWDVLLWAKTLLFPQILPAPLPGRIDLRTCLG